MTCVTKKEISKPKVTEVYQPYLKAFQMYLEFNPKDDPDMVSTEVYNAELMNYEAW